MSQIFVSNTATSTRTKQTDLSFFPQNENFVLTNFTFYNDEENKQYNEHHVFCIKQNEAIKMAIAILQATNVIDDLQIEKLKF